LAGSNYFFCAGIAASYFAGSLARDPKIETRPRTGTATSFMLLEFLALFITLAAALGTITRLGKAAPRPRGQIAAVALTAMGLLGLFFFAWQK
jgi:hypothetical protein